MFCPSHRERIATLDTYPSGGISFLQIYRYRYRAALTFSFSVYPSFVRIRTAHAVWWKSLNFLNAQRSPKSLFWLVVHIAMCGKINYLVSSNYSHAFPASTSPQHSNLSPDIFPPTLYVVMSLLQIVSKARYIIRRVQGQSTVKLKEGVTAPKFPLNHDALL